MKRKRRIHGSYDPIVFHVEKYGQSPPPTPKATPKWIRDIFEKEKEPPKQAMP